MRKLNFNGVNNMRNERCAQIDGVFGAPWLGAAFRLNEKRRQAIPLANSLILERCRRGMFIGFIAQRFSSSIGAAYDRCRSYGARKNRLPGSINIALLRSQGQKDWRSEFASGIPSQGAPKAAAISSQIVDFIQL
jgi:hypothetical protein